MSTLVIGSGITGMAAALLLARLGERVSILEAAPAPAPLLSGFTRDGLHFDTGFHCGAGLRPGGVLRLWLQALGVLEHIAADAFHPVEEEFHFLPEPDAAPPGPLVTRFPATLEALEPLTSAQFGAQAAHDLLRLTPCVH